jgi:ubiquinone biosynthesis monooxygenase Coq7
MERIGRIARRRPLGDRIIRVNHAGEHGAISIYTGQIALARFTAPGLVAELEAFRSHERRHLALFSAELARRGCPRCRSFGLCGLGGLGLGAVTGLFGARAIAATTVAVERVVLRHLEQQLEALRDVDPHAVIAISAIVAEEREHHDRAAGQGASHGVWARVLDPIVSGATEAVIWLGMRL